MGGEGDERVTEVGGHARRQAGRVAVPGAAASAHSLAAGARPERRSDAPLFSSDGASASSAAAESAAETTAPSTVAARKTSDVPGNEKRISERFRARRRRAAPRAARRRLRAAANAAEEHSPDARRAHRFQRGRLLVVFPRVRPEQRRGELLQRLLSSEGGAA